jgi:DNA primase
MDLIDLAKEIGLEPKREASTDGGEYKSSCPACGGTKRFRIWPNKPDKNSTCVGTYWCRECRKGGNAIRFCVNFMGLSWQEAAQKLNVQIFNRHDYMPPVERSFVPPTLMSPNDKWAQRAADFVQWASNQILSRPAILRSLEKRGLSIDAVKAYRIGYCDRDFFVDPAEFGLEREKDLFLPEGIVIPSIEPSGKIVRLKIRRTKWKAGDGLPKYMAIPGSMNGLNIVGDVRKLVMIVLESELDAYAAHHAGKELLFAVSVGSNTKNPDNVVDYWAKRRRLLICYDNDDGGLAMNEKWKRLYSHAESFPVPLECGKDIGDALGNGFNLSEWLNELVNKK